LSNNKKLNDMKTYNFSTRNSLLKSVIGLLGLTVVSCGTYQNKSYYDNDGIYGAKTQEREVVSADNGNKPVSEANQKYKEYFGSNANNYSMDQSETFTDVENYSSENDTIENGDYKSYAAWGDNDKDVTINVYNNDWGWNNYYDGYWNNYWAYRPWGYGIYLGWNSWNYGWNNPYWGYSGYYGLGWYNPYYGGYYGYNNWNNGYYYGNSYAYNHGRRGSSYGGRYTANNVVSSRDYTRPGRGNSNITPRRSNYNSQNPRTIDQIRPRRTDTRPGTNSETIYNTPRPRRTNTESETRPRNEALTPRPRSESNTPRTYNPTRSESSSPRSSYDSPRSSSSGSSSGGGRSGGGRRG
jgi:hypothetical protein